MSLYENWIRQAYNKEGQSEKKLWNVYMPLEQKIYEDMLENKTTLISGTPKTLGEAYNMSPEFVCGFIDGVNNASKAPLTTEEIEGLEEDQAISLEIDFEKLFKKMVEYKAVHLYTLPQWENIFTTERQKEMISEQKKSGTIVKEAKPSRNDPCPCGSGKKYKKCCGAM